MRSETSPHRDDKGWHGEWESALQLNLSEEIVVSACHSKLNSSKMGTDTRARSGRIQIDSILVPWAWHRIDTKGRNFCYRLRVVIAAASCPGPG